MGRHASNPTATKNLNMLNKNFGMKQNPKVKNIDSGRYAFDPVIIKPPRHETMPLDYDYETNNPM